MFRIRRPRLTIRHRARPSIGPFTFHGGLFKGLTSITTRLGPLSWNSRRKGTRVDLPGGFHGEID